VNNWGASQASGQVLCLLNDDTEVITPDWLERLVARAMLPGVGAVGAMMYYPNETIQHVGVILGLGGVAGHAFHDEPRGIGGYFSRACLEQDLSCVTAGCLAIRRDLFLAQGGFDERFTIAYNDVDFCIRLRAAGWRILWTPTVELYHRESASVGRPKSNERRDKSSTAVALMRKLWGPVLDSDPYYNPNLSLRSAFNLAFPPRLDLKEATERRAPLPPSSVGHFR
jgi:GT2 family glycosyltransferase